MLQALRDTLKGGPQVIQTRRSEIAETKLCFEGNPMSFERYKFSRKIIDTKAKGIVFKCGRQTAKSFTLGTATLTSLVSTPYRKYLYVAPTLTQTRVFSSDKIESRIRESPDFKKLFVDKECTRNVFEKSFTNEARIYFRAATQLDTIRGISVHVNLFDEIQDIPLDNLGVIEETMSGREDNNIWYAGTPKTIHNGIETLWQRSSQVVPILVCPAGHHNIPGVELIHRTGLLCQTCKEKIDVENSYLKRMGKEDTELTGFWIPQIVLPLHVNNPDKWAKLVFKKENLPADQFLNEVMGLSAGEGMYLLQEKHLATACSNPEPFEMWEQWQERYSNGRISGIQEFWAGIDWGHTARRSYSVIMIGGYDTATRRFVVVYAKKFLSANPLAVVDECAKLIEDFNVTQVIPDYGGGWGVNELLASKVGCPVIPCMYAGERIRWQYDVKGQMYKASRSRSLIDSFKQIRTGRISFFQWSQFRELAKMFLAEYQETSEDNRLNVVTKFDHSDDDPDDALHAFNLLYNAWKFKYDPAGLYFPG